MPILKKKPLAAAPEADEYAAAEEPEFKEESTAAADDDGTPKGSAADMEGGWDYAEKKYEEASKGGQWSYNFKVEGEPKLIAFLQGAPVDVFEQHWVEREGQKSFRCIREDCPLCDAGNQPRNMFAFHVLAFEDDGKDGIDTPDYVWVVGPQVFSQLKDVNNDPKKGGPLKGKYFAVHRTGIKKKAVTHVVGVKARDVEDDWGIPADSAEEVVKEAQKTAHVALYQPSRDELEKIAREVRR